MPLQHWRTWTWHLHDGLAFFPVQPQANHQPPGHPSSFTPSRSGSIEATKPNKRKSWFADGLTKRQCFDRVKNPSYTMLYTPQKLSHGNLKKLGGLFVGRCFFPFRRGAFLGSISYSKLIHFLFNSFSDPIHSYSFSSFHFQRVSIKVINKTGSK